MIIISYNENKISEYRREDMLIVISPAKNLDFNRVNETLPMSEPRFLKESRIIMEELKKYDSYSLTKLMKISDKLANLNRDRFEKWTDSIEDARQCLLVFKGEAFRGMDVGGFKAEDFFYADNHLRILSGLYGILSPFDGVHQYRLEMGTKISIRGKKDLYDFWGDTISKVVIEDIKNTGDNVLVNLASKEYFKVIEKIEEIDDEIKVITPVFKEYRDGKYKIISTKAKRARGLMTSFIIKNKIESIEALKEFKEEGYEFCDEMSTDSELTFILNDAIYVE